MLHELLQAHLERVYPNRSNILVSSVETLPAGWETDIFRFTLEYDDNSGKHMENLVLRRYPERASSNAEHEFEVMKTLEELGYPVPRLHLKETDGTVLDGPFIIMDAINGETMGDLLASSPHKEQAHMLREFGELFVKLHRLATDTCGEIMLGRKLSIEDLLSVGRTQVVEYGLHHLLPIIDWLESRSDDTEPLPLSITHMDFHPYNIMIDRKKQPFVIDWTASRIIDPRFDLGWTLLLSYAFTGPDLRETFLQSYEAANGSEVADIEFFEVAATLRRLLDVSVSLTTSATERGMREGAADAIRESIYHMRNVHNRLYELTGLRIAEVDQLINDNS
jgi:aminoglycoside phosphotransferase (APT) family kinase protein